ncbi:hypothetical protein Tco_0359073 [Tanacetum coccineum]
MLATSESLNLPDTGLDTVLAPHSIEVRFINPHAQKLKLSKQSKTSPKPLIGQDTIKNDTRISKEAHQKGEYCTEINAKEAHHSKDTRLPRWQSVCLNFDPRAKKGHPMIGND